MRILNNPLIPEKMESLDHSPSPEFSPLAIGEDFTPLPTYKAATTSAYDMSGLLSTPLQLHEDLASGCGGQTWPAGMVLTKHMLRYHRENLKGARMLVIEPPLLRTATSASFLSLVVCHVLLLVHTMQHDIGP